MEAVAKLNNYPTGPRKMRLLADVIRGMQVEKALAILEHHPQHNALPLAKLLKSAINNWEQKNSVSNAADSGLVVKTIFVDGGRVIKRMRPAPQGRGYKIRKRSNHVTLIVDVK
jgi:large subunit ribosomal protein L22